LENQVERLLYTDQRYWLQARIFTCEQLRDYLRDSNKDIDIIEFANLHIDYLKENGREPYSRTFRKIRNSLIDYFGRSKVSINEIHSNMLYAYERFLKNPRKQIRINQLGKEVNSLPGAPNDFVAKPFDIDYLLTKIEEQL
jgi:hypothetical protein